MNIVKTRWRVAYRQPWAHLADDDLRAHLEAARDVLARVEASDRDGYFAHLWQVRVSELQFELSNRHDASQRRKRGKGGKWA